MYPSSEFKFIKVIRAGRENTAILVLNNKTKQEEKLKVPNKTVKAWQDSHISKEPATSTNLSEEQLEAAKDSVNPPFFSINDPTEGVNWDEEELIRRAKFSG